MYKHEYLNKLKQQQPSHIQKYEYDLIPFEFKMADKIPIRCKTHGVFLQKPSSQLYGIGCPQCANSNKGSYHKLTTSCFIQLAILKHGNKYDYSKVNYVNKYTAVTITCQKHGDFNQIPNVHLNSSYGCPTCGRLATVFTKEKFIELSTLAHGNRYDYSKVNYVNTDTKVEIICNKHGSFYQTPYLHYAKKNNCPACATDNDKLTLEEFIKRAEKLHGNKYNYSKVIYSTGDTPVTIICPTHGVFEQKPRIHLSGSGCKTCFTNNRMSLEEFIARSKNTHGDKYDYSKVNYVNNKIHVEIICPKHGSFIKRPDQHIHAKAGCPRCIESKGEIAVAGVLDKYNIKYLKEYKIYPYLYRYDFYLPEYNVFIEFHGVQHYSAIERFGGKIAYDEVVKRDIAKAMLVKTNNGLLITIKHTVLDNNDIERYLIYKLKQLYRYWFVIDGKIFCYRSFLCVCKAFNLPPETTPKTLLKDLRIVVDFQILF